EGDVEEKLNKSKEEGLDEEALNDKLEKESGELKKEKEDETRNKKKSEENINNAIQHIQQLNNWNVENNHSENTWDKQRMINW
ncbi:13938_t:CDS:2, partial [Funneliformis geosporum]